MSGLGHIDFISHSKAGIRNPNFAIISLKRVTCHVARLYTIAVLFQVTLVRWNEPYQKLASCDSSGIIFVWIKYEGRWSIELINDRNTPVICFSWSHDGRMALICYQVGCWQRAGGSGLLAAGCRQWPATRWVVGSGLLPDGLLGVGNISWLIIPFNYIDTGLGSLIVKAGQSIF